MSQIITTFAGGFAQPNQPTNLKLAEGLYSLSSMCNLPYVRLTGSKGFQKTISWGEYAEVPCGELVTVENASAHPGNLYINSGVDQFAQPSRITVPTKIISEGVEFGDAQTEYVFDVRRAKRAYLFVSDVLGPFTATVIGRSKNSHTTENMIVAPNVGPGYVQTHDIPALSAIPPIPLGFRAPMGDDSRPMALLDTVIVTFDTTFMVPTAYFVAEYL